MAIYKEFKEFIAKGNVIDLAVGVVIGAAFGKIVSSLVEDIIMPPIGLLLGGVNFDQLKTVLKEAHTDASGAVVKAVTINWGTFFQNAFSFLIIALVIFLFVVKPVNLLKRKEEVAPAAPPPLTKEEALLTEIRDALRK
jgi:large conductance mechanosensitive channel